MLGKGKPGLTWDKNSHLLRFSSVFINALIHPCVLPAHVPHIQNARRGADLFDFVAVTTIFIVVPLKHPSRLFRAGADKCEMEPLGQDELSVIR